MTHSFNRQYTRFIPSEEIQGVTHWQFGTVDSTGVIPPPDAEAEAAAAAAAADALIPPGIDPAEHEALLLQARESAHAEGVEQGRSQAALEWQRRMDDYIADQGREAAERLQRLALATQSALDGMQQRMAGELLELACDLARQVVRRELAADPQALLPVVREALALLVAEGRPATVRLSREDWALLEQPLSQEFAGAKVQWVSDAQVQPGDCLVESAGTVLDGSLDKRWRRAIAALGLAAAWNEPRPGADAAAPESVEAAPEAAVAPVRQDDAEGEGAHAPA